jgi:hypothetical protein
VVRVVQERPAADVGPKRGAGDLLPGAGVVDDEEVRIARRQVGPQPAGTVEVARGNAGQLLRLDAMGALPPRAPRSVVDADAAVRHDRDRRPVRRDGEHPRAEPAGRPVGERELVYRSVEVGVEERETAGVPPDEQPAAVRGAVQPGVRRKIERCDERGDQARLHSASLVASDRRVRQNGYSGRSPRMVTHCTSV